MKVLNGKYFKTVEVSYVEDVRHLRVPPVIVSGSFDVDCHVFNQGKELLRHLEAVLYFYPDCYIFLKQKIDKK